MFDNMAVEDIRFTKTIPNGIKPILKKKLQGKKMHLKR